MYKKEGNNNIIIILLINLFIKYEQNKKIILNKLTT